MKNNMKTKNSDIIMLEVADVLAQESKCVSKKVCAILVKNGRICGTGLNGSITGLTNCCEVFSEGDIVNDRMKHREWSLKNEIHAEMNLITDMTKRGISSEGGTIYVNLQPCNHCAHILLNLGIKRIVFSRYYDRNSEVETLEIKRKFEKLGIVYEYIGIDE